MTISFRKAATGGLATLGAVVLMAGCASAPEEETGDSAAEAIDYLPCIVSDSGGFDDKSFNQLSYEGVVEASEELGSDYIDVESNAETDYTPNLENLVAQGCDTIVSVGFALSAPTVEIATANPELEFVLVDDAADNDFDGTKDAENVKPLLYDTAQAAFLAGYLAAGYSEAGKVGTFGGMEFPTVTIFMDGFKQGVDYYNSEKGTDVEVIGWDGSTGSFTGGFEANQDAKNVAQNIIDQGVDVLLPVGGPIYQSAIAAIDDSGEEIALIGVDADFYESDPSTQPYVLTSILKGMKVSTYEAVVAAGMDEWDPETYIGTLENDGVGIAPFHDFEDAVSDELAQEVEDLKAGIIDGSIEVTSYLAG